MKKKLPVVLCTVMAALFAFGITDVKAENKDAAWNYDKVITKTSGAFTYHAYTSRNGKEAWIYKIDINKNKKHSSLSIPEVLDNKSVTRLGFTGEAFEDYDDFNKNLFDVWVELCHEADGSSPAVDGIKKITIPDSVKVIQPSTFSGMDSITAITIPEKVTAIKEETFYGCDSLKTVHLPAGLKQLDKTALQGCPQLSKVSLSSKNKTYRVKNNCIIAKKDQALIYVIPSDQTLNIPNGTKILKAYAFNNCTSPTVHIPASVIRIEGDAFHKSSLRQNEKIKDVTISEKNKVYAKDGQCIYNKKDNSLSVAIVDENGVLRISDQVKNLTDTYSMVNCNTWDDDLNKVVFPRTLKSATVPAFSLLSNADQVYFTGAKPPKIKKPKEAFGYAALPIFTDIYVPMDSAEVYKKWYKKHKCYSSVDHWFTFDPMYEI